MLEPISVSMESLNLGTLAPMLVAIVGALGILVIDLIKKDLDKTLYVMLSVLILFVDLGAVFGQRLGDRGFFDVMLIDGLAILSQIVILAASMLFIPLALTSRRFHEYSYPEFFALFLFMVAGFQFMVASDNLILIFVGLETASLALYTLIALHNRERSFEAAIKYFVMGALAAGFYVMGAMVFYALTGSVELYKIAEILSVSGFANMTLVLVGVSFMIAAIGFKLSMVPFHTWTPDVYEGASAALAGYMSVVPKIAGFVVAMRVFELLIHSDVVWVRDVLYVAVVVTMTLANIIALVQRDVKRMLAFSSISHAGFVMAAIMIGTTQANSALFLYWILFLFTNLGAFAMLWVSRHKAAVWGDGRFDHPYEKFAGMIHIMPVGAVVMALFMLSLAGVPPFSLFWGKLYIMSAAVNSDYIILALIMAINSAISAYYYLKLIVYMFLKDPSESGRTVYMKNASKPLQTIIGFSVFLTVFAVLAVDPMWEFISTYVQASGF